MGTIRWSVNTSPLLARMRRRKYALPGAVFNTAVNLGNLKNPTTVLLGGDPALSDRGLLRRDGPAVAWPALEIQFLPPLPLQRAGTSTPGGLRAAARNTPMANGVGRPRPVHCPMASQVRQHALSAEPSGDLPLVALLFPLAPGIAEHPSVPIPHRPLPPNSAPAACARRHAFHWPMHD